MTNRNQGAWLASVSAFATVCAVSSLGIAGRAHAADAEAAVEVDEVIVTANKREQKVLDVALSVTAVKGSDLAKRSVLQVEDLAAQVPGLAIENYSKRANRIVLRGLNSGGPGATVASVIDESALSYSSSTANGAIDIANLDTYDLNRIEVLRGPQGTLYGAAAEGGLVKYITNAPNPSRFEAGLQGEVESVAHGGTGWTTRGLVNIPLSGGKAAIRASAFYKDIAGVVDNPRTNQEDQDWGKRYGGRIQALFEPTDDLSIRLGAILQRQYFNGSGRIQIVGNASGTNTLGRTLTPVHGYSLYSSQNTTSANRLALYTATVDYKGSPFGNFLSATSYGKIDSTFHVNYDDPTAAPGLSYGDYFSLFIAGQPVHTYLDQTNNLNKFDQEFRLSSKPDATLFGKKVEWVAGLFYTHEEITFDQVFDMFSVATGELVTSPTTLGGNYAPADYKEASAFASGTVWLTDRFNVQLGGRYSKSWQKSQISYLPGVFTGFTDILVNPVIKSNEKVFTWSVAPQYFFTEDAQVYARVATGFRPGGPQLAIPFPPPDYPREYHSDSTTNYEVGLKGQFFDRRLVVDVAAFRIDWKDIQILTEYVTPNNNSYFVTGNAGSARSQGFEWNVLARPVAGLELGFLGAYTDAKLTADAPLLVGMSGDRLAYVPKWTATVNLDYRWTVRDRLEASVGGSWSYRGDRFTSFSTDPDNNHLPLPSYALLSMHAGLDYDRFSAALYVNNLTDEYVVNGYAPSGWLAENTGVGYYIQPRTIGIRLGYKY